MSVNPADLPTLPDHVTDAINSGIDLPIEALVSPAAAEAAYDMQKARTAPVHAEDLTPISAAEGAARRTQQGDALPAMPTMRRVIPAPYRRERINASRHGKTWQSARADSIVAGDMVQDVGRVVAVAPVVVYADRATIIEGPRTGEEIKVAVGTRIIMRNIVGDNYEFDAADQVRVHRKAPGDDQ